MSSFFNPDSAVMQWITKIVYSVWLNLLWLICCIPIVTAGASTTALYYVTLKMVRNEEGNITKTFFRAFRENFKQSTKTWLVLLAVGIVLAVDGYTLYHLRFENAFWTIITAVFIVVLVAYAIILMYIFPLMARFQNTTLAMVRNSVMIGVRYLVCTALMACVYFVMTLVVVRFFTPAIIFGEGLCALLCSCLLSNIMKALEEAASDDKTAAFEEPEENMTTPQSL